MINFEKKEDLTLKEVYYRATLDSGLKITVIPKTFPNVFAMICCDFGGIDIAYKTDEGEFTLPAGTAHFLEHKMFETADGGDAFSEFDNYGGYANAFTSYENTCYYFSCTSNFWENLDILLRSVSSVHFTDESVEKERKIISREIMMYEDQPTSNVTRNLMKSLYHNHPTRYPIAGTIETISGITKETLFRAYRDFYTPKNLNLCICGDVDKEKVAVMAEKYFPATGKKPPETIIESEPKEVKSHICENIATVGAPLFSIGIKCPPMKTSLESYRKASAMRLAISLTFGRASDFYCNNYAEGLLSERFFAGYTQSRTAAHVCISGSSNDPKTVFERAKAEIKRRQEIFFTEEQFRREKRAAFAECLTLFDNGEDITATFATDCSLPYDEYDCINIFKEITMEEVFEALKSLNVENSAISIVYNKKGE